MKFKALIIVMLQIILLGCSDMTNWQEYNDAGWQKNEDEQYKEALELYKIAYKKIHFGFFIDKEGLAALTTNMAATYRALGDYENAEKYYLESLKAWEKLVGKTHENYAIISNNYSLFLEAQHKYDEALKYSTDALKIRKKLFGTNSEDVVDSHRGISSIYLNKGQFEHAIEHAELALSSAIAAHGPGSELVASSELTLGRAYRAANDIINAVPHISNAIEIYQSISPHSTRAADTVNELALLQQNSEQYSLADKNFHKALNMYLKIYEKNHPYIAIMYANIAFNYLDWGKFEEALEAIKESVKINTTVFGARHQNTIDASKSCMQIAEINQTSPNVCAG